MSPDPATDEYLEAFLNGLEFALLAVEGRLASSPETKEFVTDYRRVLSRYRARRAAPPPEIVKILGRIVAEAEVAAPARN